MRKDGGREKEKFGGPNVFIAPPPSPLIYIVAGLRSRSI